ncbi:hypothetical protein J6590_018657 [Homalodisca vitripennis]|nr:hypothetical protein J6590_018657 [Homalodisca vitripennis]
MTGSRDRDLQLMFSLAFCEHYQYNERKEGIGIKYRHVEGGRPCSQAYLRQVRSRHGLATAEEMEAFSRRPGAEHAAISLRRDTWGHLLRIHAGEEFLS